MADNSEILETATTDSPAAAPLKPADAPVARTDHTAKPETEGLASGYSPLAAATYRMMKLRFEQRKKK